MQRMYRADIMAVENHKVNPDGCICIAIEAENSQKAQEYLNWLFHGSNRNWFNLEVKNQETGEWENGF